VRKLLKEEDAVSPVIGVILMVAITVILAAVIASFVLGLGGSTSKTPQAKFTFDYQADGSNSYGNLSITHDGGTTIKATELVIRGQGFSSGSPSNGNTVSTWAIESSDKTWDDAADGTVATASGDKGGESAVVSGDYLTAWVDNDYDIRVVYESSEGDNSATLASDTGPNTS